MRSKTKTKATAAVVTGACGAGKVEFVQSLGAQAAIDYTRDDFSQGE